ncbi:hypothetical protein [Streptomyces sp. NPDC093984]|uniref:hypothetical protein n=1 Tax=Streptomyces sp. NPDC093984 TaxID=3366052 RepID=UPI003810F528
MEAALESAPGASLIVATERFDAVMLPRDIGMAAMVHLDRKARMPCLVYDCGAVALLVAASTGRHCRVDEAVEVRTGPDGWVALPPSRGVRWDNPPWVDGTREPCQLVSGAEATDVLAECFSIRWAVPR